MLETPSHYCPMVKPFPLHFWQTDSLTAPAGFIFPVPSHEVHLRSILSFGFSFPLGFSLGIQIFLNHSVEEQWIQTLDFFLKGLSTLTKSSISFDIVFDILAL